MNVFSLCLQSEQRRRHGQDRHHHLIPVSGQCVGTQRIHHEHAGSQGNSFAFQSTVRVLLCQSEDDVGLGVDGLSLTDPGGFNSGNLQ